MKKTKTKTKKQKTKNKKEQTASWVGLNSTNWPAATGRFLEKKREVEIFSPLLVYFFKNHDKKGTGCDENHRRNMENCDMGLLLAMARKRPMHNLYSL